MDYATQQAWISRRAKELEACFPHLKPRSPSGKSTVGWVAGNVRRFFQHQWPDIPCSTRSDTSSAGFFVQLDYPQLPAAPTREEVKQVLGRFCSQRYDPIQETFVSNEDQEYKAFRKAFGGLSSLSVVPRKPSPEDVSRHLKTHLSTGAAPKRNSPRL